MGKASKHRPCPALHREISPAECGDGRNRRIECPASCPFNPFNPECYDTLLAIESALDVASLRRLFEESRDPAALEGKLRATARDDDSLEVHAFLMQQLYFERDAAGLTCVERWERTGPPGLKNDERNLLRAKRQTRVGALEVHRVLDGQFIEGVDLLAPEAGPLRILDRSLAAVAARFSVYFSWLYPLPFFWRISGTAMAIPDFGAAPSPDEMLDETLQHLGIPPADQPDARRAWLAGNFLRICDSFTATSHARRRQAMEGIDAQFGAATYELGAPYDECRAALADEPAIEKDNLGEQEKAEGFVEGLVCFDDVAPAFSVPAGGRAVLGRILLGQKHWRIEGMGAARFARLRRRFEERLGTRVRFLSERRDDLGRRLALDEPEPADPALVPPKLLTKPMQLALSSSRLPPLPPGATTEEMRALVIRESLRRFPDEPVPALDDRTPREAARDPALRPRLIRQVKSRVRQIDEDNLRDGRDEDINWLIRDLGLSEIDFPPPPPRAPPEEPDAEDDFEPEEVNAPVPRERHGRGPGRVLPGAFFGVLSLKDAAERLSTALDHYETAADALKALDASGSTLIDDVSSLTADSLDDDQFAILLTYLLKLWFAIVPHGTPAPALDHDRMEAAFDRDLAHPPMPTPGDPPAQFGALLRTCRQPNLLTLVLADLLERTPKLPKKHRPDDRALLVMTYAIKAAIDELDRAMRGE
jgi:hypothetical protein